MNETHKDYLSNFPEKNSVVENLTSRLNKIRNQQGKKMVSSVDKTKSPQSTGNIANRSKIVLNPTMTILIVVINS